MKLKKGDLVRIDEGQFSGAIARFGKECSGGYIVAILACGPEPISPIVTKVANVRECDQVQAKRHLADRQQPR
jgi:hypothetical protein